MTGAEAGQKSKERHVVKQTNHMVIIMRSVTWRMKPMTASISILFLSANRELCKVYVS